MNERVATVLALIALASKTSPEIVFKSEVKDGFSLFNFDDGIDLCVSQVLVYLSPKSYNINMWKILEQLELAYALLGPINVDICMCVYVWAHI